VPFAVSGAGQSVSLRWRIPPEGDPRDLRLALTRTVLAAIVGALVLLVAAPREVLGWALVSLVPLAALVALWQWRRHQSSLAGAANLWIDNAGIHWLDASGSVQTLARQEIVGFRVAVEEDTLRTVPALTVYLSGGLESQPLELHPPATPESVRQLLTGQWRLEERASASGANGPGYDLAIDVYSEPHDEFQEWHLEGTAAALGELFDVLAEVAELPLAPLGVKPARRIVQARRREASRLSIEHDRHTRLGMGVIAGSADLLVDLATHARTALTKDLPTSGEGDLKFDFILGKGNVWTFHLHVRQSKDV
jgi:hypothetical protein